MAFEIALITAFLGISLILAYIGSQIDDKNWFFIAIKIFLFSAAIILLFYTSGMNVPLLKYVNETTASVYTNASGVEIYSMGLTNSTYTALNNYIGKGVSAVSWVLRISAILGFLLLCWWVLERYNDLIEQGKKIKGRGLEPFDKV